MSQAKHQQLREIWKQVRDIYMCPLCRRAGLTVRGIASHRCRANNDRPLNHQQLREAWNKIHWRISRGGIANSTLANGKVVKRKGRCCE